MQKSEVTKTDLAIGLHLHSIEEEAHAEKKYKNFSENKCFHKKIKTWGQIFLCIIVDEEFLLGLRGFGSRWKVSWSKIKKYNH